MQYYGQMNSFGWSNREDVISHPTQLKLSDCVSSGNIWVWIYSQMHISQKHMTPDRYEQFTHPVPPRGRQSRHLSITRCCRSPRHAGVLRSPSDSYAGWKTIGNETEIERKGKEEFSVRPALLSSRSSSPLTRRTGLSSSSPPHTNTSSPLDKPVLLKSH